MLILTNPIQLQSKKVIADIASREGMHTKDSYSYGLGLYYVVKKYAGSQYEAVDDIAALIQKQTDFDADIVRPLQNDEEDYDSTYDGLNTPGELYNPAIHDVNYTGYYRRLEDINNAYLEKYIGNLIFSVRAYNGNGLKAYNSNHKIQQALQNVNGDDDSEFTEMSDLLFEDTSDVYSNQEVYIAREQLPYVLKRLLNLSALLEIHMPSFIVAFNKVNTSMTELRAKGLSTARIKWTSVADVCTYKADRLTGAATQKIFKESKNVKAQEAYAWVIGVSDAYQGYVIDMQNFIHYLKVLHIKMDPNAFVSISRDTLKNCMITTVTPNSSYIPDVKNAILNNSSNAQSVDELDDTENTMELLEQVISVHPEAAKYLSYMDSNHFEQRKKDAQNLAIMAYNFRYNQYPDVSRFMWKDGYLYYGPNLVVLPSNYFYSNDLGSAANCIFSEFGLVVKITDRNVLEFLFIEHAKQNYIDALNNVPANEQEGWKNWCV